MGETGDSACSPRASCTTLRSCCCYDDEQIFESAMGAHVHRKCTIVAIGTCSWKNISLILLAITSRSSLLAHWIGYLYPRIMHDVIKRVFLSQHCNRRNSFRGCVVASTFYSRMHSLGSCFLVSQHPRGPELNFACILRTDHICKGSGPVHARHSNTPEPPLKEAFQARTLNAIASIQMGKSAACHTCRTRALLEP